MSRQRTCNALQLQRTATHCNSLQHTAADCNTLRQTAIHCNTLQHTAKRCNIDVGAKQAKEVVDEGKKESPRRATATTCNTLQHNATHCNTLQHTTIPRAATLVATRHCTRPSRNALNVCSRVACVLQRVVCCSVSRCVAMCCSDILQCIAVTCPSRNALNVYLRVACVKQCVAACCSVLPVCAVCCSLL